MYVCMYVICLFQLGFGSDPGFLNRLRVGSKSKILIYKFRLRSGPFGFGPTKAGPNPNPNRWQPYFGHTFFSETTLLPSRSRRTQPLPHRHPAPPASAASVPSLLRTPSLVSHRHRPLHWLALLVSPSLITILVDADLIVDHPLPSATWNSVTSSSPCTSSPIWFR